VALAGAGGSAVGLGAPGWLAGAVGAVSALVAAAVVDRVFHARDDRAAAAERRSGVLDVLVAAAAPGDRDDVLGLLRPDRSPVPFRGRGAELRRLAEWLADDSANPVLVVSGPAGAGKSRLALRFASGLPQQWARGWLRAGAGAAAAGAVRACGDPAMILVDDADGRADLAAFLGAVAEGYASPVARVVLLARSAAGLAASLALRLEDRHEWIVSRAPVLELEPDGGPEDRERWFAEAVAAFAADQGAVVPALSHVGRMDADEPMLVLQAQALLAVLGAAGDAEDPRRLSFEQVAGALMKHEKRRWAAAAARWNWGAGGPPSDALQESSVTALALLGFDDGAEAEQVLRRIAELRDATAERLAAVTAFVLALCPPGPDATPSIRPRMIGEWFVVSQLTDRPGLARVLRDGLTDQQAARAISFLASAADRMESAGRLFGEFAAGDPRRRILAAAHAARTGRAGRPLLDTVIAEQIRASDDWTIDQLAELDRVIPDHVLLLTRVAVADSAVRLSRAKARDSSAANQGALAQAVRSLGAALDKVGRYQEALAADEEAVALYRVLSRDNPAGHQPDLAWAVRNLGSGLHKVGRYQEALAAEEEAVALYRVLARDNPAVHQPNLALAVLGLGAALDKVGYQEALAAEEEAVALYRVLARDNRGVHQPNLAWAVRNLGAGLDKVGRYQEALAADEEAIALYRVLARDNPAVHQPDLALAISNLRVTLKRVGRYQEALDAETEATDIFRQLASRDPDLYQKEYQQRLGALRREYDQRGLHDEAIVHHLGDPAIQPPPSPRPSS
jgi:tetratricopeptide (TPR) repeat protein